MQGMTSPFIWIKGKYWELSASPVAKKASQPSPLCDFSRPDANPGVLYH